MESIPLASISIGRIGVWACGLAIMCLAASIPGSAQDCEALSPVEGPSGYQAREASRRCEGMFAARVSGGGINLVSFTAGPLRWDIKTDRALTIAPANWLPTDGTRLQAVGIPVGLYYRLDAVMASGAPLRVPLDAVLRPEHIDPEDIGIYALRAVPGRSPQYLPVRVMADRSPPTAESGLIVTLRPSDPISAVRFRLVAAGAEPPPYMALPGAPGLVPSGRRLDIALGRVPASDHAILYIAYVDPVSGQEKAEHFDLVLR